MLHQHLRLDYGTQTESIVSGPFQTSSLECLRLLDFVHFNTDETYSLVVVQLCYRVLYDRAIDLAHNGSRRRRLLRSAGDAKSSAFQQWYAAPRFAGFTSFSACVYTWALQDQRGPPHQPQPYYGLGFPQHPGPYPQPQGQPQMIFVQPSGPRPNNSGDCCTPLCTWYVCEVRQINWWAIHVSYS